MGVPADLVRLLRPHQWIKNVFVLIGLVFGHAWDDPAQVENVARLFAAFCLLSSGVYAMNDVFDREADRAHPDKRTRPVASGRISPAVAAALAISLAAAGLAIAYRVSPVALLILAAYVLLNLAYSAGLKHVAVLDVFLIAAGFMLRILAGTLGIGIVPSHWLLLCGLLVTLFLGFAKRRAELFEHGNGLIAEGGDNPGEVPSAPLQRRSLAGYTPRLLDQMIAISAGGSLVGYALYTVDASTIALHGTDKLIYTLPVVLYAMFRYLHLLYRRGGGDDPSAELLSDPHLLIASLGWVALIWWLLYSAN
jgi:hypothetical protein